MDKVCRKCGVEKNKDEFYPNRRVCKPCFLINNKEKCSNYYQNNTEKERIRQRVYRAEHEEELRVKRKNKPRPPKIKKPILPTKICRECGLEKDRVEFSKGRAICKTCYNKQAKKRREENRDKINLSKRIKRKLNRKEKVIETVRVCRKCNIEKDILNFRPGRRVCKACDAERQRKWQKEYRKAHRDEINRRDRIRRGGSPNPRPPKKNLSPEELKLKRHEDYERNKEVIKAQNAKYRENNPEKVKASGKLSRENRSNEEKERLKQYWKEYRQKNKEKRRIQNREYERNKRANDINFKLRKAISNAVYIALAVNNSTKNNLSILLFLVYTMEVLKQHLESLFEWWMNWDNWGIYNPKTWDDNDPSTWTWQIDHIIPQSHFKYTSMDSEEFRRCWALENLRPYSAKQNILEGNRR